MTLPQSNINLFQVLTEVPRPSVVVELPRKLPNGQAVEVSLQLLTTSEAMKCKADADMNTRKWLKENPTNKEDYSVGYMELYKDFLLVNVLWFATRMKDNLKEPFFPTKDAIRDNFTPDELGILYNHYADLQLHKGVVISDLDEAELEIWIERIIRDGANSGFFLNSFTSEMLKMLLITMGNRLKNLPMDTSSLISQPENIT